MEAHEEVDIVIGDKKEWLCDTVTEFTNTETGMSCNDFTYECLVENMLKGFQALSQLHR